MGKVVKAIAIGAIIGLTAGLALPALGFAAPFATLTSFLGVGPLVGATIGGALVGGLSALLAPSVDLEPIRARTNLQIDPNATGKWVFGESPCATDVVFSANHGDNEQYVSYIVAGAAHRIESFEEFYIEDELINFDGSGEASTQGWVGHVWRQTRDGSVGQVVIPDLDASDNWTPTEWPSAAVGTGHAFYRLRWDITKDKISGGIPTRITQVVKGAPVYDPRLDDTRGGSGSHRADQQSTWQYNDGSTDIGANWALVVAFYLLGWHDETTGDLIFGVGVDPADIDWDQVIAAANVCDEIVDGKPRFRVGGIMPTSNAHEEVIGQLEGAINGRVSIIGGKYYIWAPNDDLGSPFNRIDETDIIREIGVEFEPAGDIRDLYNTAKGRFVDPSSVWQPAPYPMVTEASAVTEDGRVRLLEHDLANIHDVEIAERTARRKVRRSRFSGIWRFAMGPKGLLFTPFTPTILNCKETNNQDVTVRILDMTFSPYGAVAMTVVEEDSSIYDTSIALGTPITQLDPNAFDPYKVLTVTGLAAVPVTIQGSDGSASDGLKVTWDDPGGYIRETRVQYRITGSGADWTDAPSPVKDAFQAIIPDLRPDTEYDLRARHTTITNAIGLWSTTITATTGYAGRQLGPELMLDPNFTNQDFWDLSEAETFWDATGSFDGTPAILFDSDGTVAGQTEFVQAYGAPGSTIPTQEAIEKLPIYKEGGVIQVTILATQVQANASPREVWPVIKVFDAGDGINNPNTLDSGYHKNRGPNMAIAGGDKVGRWFEYSTTIRLVESDLAGYPVFSGTEPTPWRIAIGIRGHKFLQADHDVKIARISARYVEDVFTGGTSDTDQKPTGLVPPVGAAASGKYLKDDGTWDTPSGSGVTDHGALSGLGDNDHPQYPLKTGDEVITGEWTFEDVGSVNILLDAGVSAYANFRYKEEGGAEQTRVSIGPSTGDLFKVRNVTGGRDLLNVQDNVLQMRNFEFEINQAVGAGQDNYVLTYDHTDGKISLEAPSSLSDHGALSGLGDDDHTQYHNDARGDARYYTKTEADNKYITGVTAGTGISGGGTVGGVTVTLDFGELGVGDTLQGTDYLVAENGGVDRRQLVSNIPLSVFNNDIGAGGGITDHGALSGLADNDHPQYTRKASAETITGAWTFSTFPDFDVPPTIKAHTPSGSPASTYGRIYPDSNGQLNWQWESYGVRQIPVVQNKIKTVQEDADLDATMSDDTHITGLNIKAQEWHEFEALLLLEFPEGGAGGGFQFKFVFSATPLQAAMHGSLIIAQSVSANAIDAKIAASPASTINLTAATHGLTHLANNFIFLKGIVRGNATTDGTMKLQWAQASSDAQATRLQEGSYVTLRRIYG